MTGVVDGDTVHVRLESGKEEKVRFVGVDTPESTREVEPYGKEAAAYTEKRLNGRTVYLELDVGERDKYGRLLAYVWLSLPETDGEAEVRAKMFNAELLLEGYAQVMTVPPNVKYADLFVKFRREARERSAGLGVRRQSPNLPVPLASAKNSCDRSHSGGLPQLFSDFITAISFFGGGSPTCWTPKVGLYQPPPASGSTLKTTRKLPRTRAPKAF